MRRRLTFRPRLLAAAVAALTMSALPGCSGPTVVYSPSAPASATAEQFFLGSDSPWTRPVPPDAPADPRSVEYVARLAPLDPVVSVRKYSVPVFVAGADAPRYTVRRTASWLPPGSVLDHVPIPEHARPDPAEDAHMVVLDSSSRCVYEFYRARRDGEGWAADWVNASPADGDGSYPDGLSTRASGLSAAAGLIWPEELRDGEIDHALVFGYPFTRAGGPVGMATESDGDTVDDAALPIGAHLVLDPAVDIDALNLPPAERAIAEALQRYGMVLADSSGGFTLYAVQPTSFSADPYTPIWGDVTWASIGQIPFDRMKVLPLGEQKPPYAGPPIPNRCTATATPAP